MNTEDYLTPLDKAVRVGDIILYSEPLYPNVSEGQVTNIDFPVIEIEQNNEPTSKQKLNLTKIEILRIVARG